MGVAMGVASPLQALAPNRFSSLFAVFLALLRLPHAGASAVVQAAGRCLPQAYALQLEPSCAAVEALSFPHETTPTLACGFNFGSVPP